MKQKFRAVVYAVVAISAATLVPLSLLNSSSSSSSSSSSIEEIRKRTFITDINERIDALEEALRQVTERQWLPLKDATVHATAEPDRTWFMSTLRRLPRDGHGHGHGHGHPESFQFPSAASNGNVLCVALRDAVNGSLNSYMVAPRRFLPLNATLLRGLTFVADQSYDYSNPWHGLTTLAPVVAWELRNASCRGSSEPPWRRFLLFRDGAPVQGGMGSWVSAILAAVLGSDGDVRAEALPLGARVCFERAVVFRRGLHGISAQNRLRVFDEIRCQVRRKCGVAKESRNVDEGGSRGVNVTLLARTGARAFRNESAVAETIADECSRVAGCRFQVARIAELGFCEQVRLMAETDVLATAHGAQLTNMVFMERGSSVMEMFPKGWLQGAGPGQYVYHWLADWTAMAHRGVYRDPDSEGPDCPFSGKNDSSDGLRCFLFFKDLEVGLNRTFLADWTARVVAEFLDRAHAGGPGGNGSGCACHA